MIALVLVHVISPVFALALDYPKATIFTHHLQFHLFASLPLCQSFTTCHSDFLPVATSSIHHITAIFSRRFTTSPLSCIATLLYRLLATSPVRYTTTSPCRHITKMPYSNITALPHRHIASSTHLHIAKSSD